MDGVPWHSIVETVEHDPDVDLVVVGTHGRTGIPRVLLGSVAERVVRHAPCSVLVTRRTGDTTPFAHILVPIDFSEPSRLAVERATELAAVDGAGILLLHSVELPAYYDSELGTELLASIEKGGATQLATSADELRAKTTVPVTSVLRHGSPGASSVNVLEEDPTFDLVVVGSHGRTGFKRALLGSVAEKIVRHAPCSVLVARARS